MSELIKLGPCAHCGGEASDGVDIVRGGGIRGHVVWCRGCGVQTKPRRRRDDAIAAWNKRSHAGSVSVPREFVRFLLGSESHGGVWFHDLHPTRKGCYWWRTDLQAMLDAAGVG